MNLNPNGRRRPRGDTIFYVLLRHLAESAHISNPPVLPEGVTHPPPDCVTAADALLDRYYRLCKISFVTGELNEVTTGRNIPNNEAPKHHSSSVLYDARHSSVHDEIR